MSAGLDRHGPAASDYVGRVEAAAMVRAWRSARTAAVAHARTRHALDAHLLLRPGRGRQARRVAVRGRPPVPDRLRGGARAAVRHHAGALRGPPPAGGRRRSARSQDPARHRGRAAGDSIAGAASRAADDRLRPGRGHQAGGRAHPPGRRRGDRGVGHRGGGWPPAWRTSSSYYLTTPEEYDRQHYEGGNTHFGRMSSVLVQRELAKLAGNLARGEPAAAPFAFDSKNGVAPDGPPYPAGAATGAITAQPASGYGRLQRATLAWDGGAQGLDRPVDRAFVSAQRRKGRRWVTQDSDLGLAMLWKVDDNGRHSVAWRSPWTSRAAPTASLSRKASTGSPRAPSRCAAPARYRWCGIPARAGRGGGRARVPGR